MRSKRKLGTGSGDFLRELRARPNLVRFRSAGSRAVAGFAREDVGIVQF